MLEEGAFYTLGWCPVCFHILNVRNNHCFQSWGDIKCKRFWYDIVSLNPHKQSWERGACSTVLWLGSWTFFWLFHRRQNYLGASFHTQLHSCADQCKMLPNFSQSVKSPLGSWWLELCFSLLCASQSTVDTWTAQWVEHAFCQWKRQNFSDTGFFHALSLTGIN